MCDIICISNRSLCKGNFLSQIENIATASFKPKSIILREKDLSPDEYKLLAEKTLEICNKNGVECILHSFYGIAKELDVRLVHIPLKVLKEMSDSDKKQFDKIGTSCHSLEDVKEAERLGCSYVVAGHIFETDCKKGLNGRGLDFLRSVTESTQLPVYAIGGITPKNISDVMSCGVKGACVMSGLMTSENVNEYLKEFDRCENNEI